MLALFHPGPSLATALAAVVFAVALGLTPAAALVKVGVPMLFTQLAISVLNDVVDRDRDAASGRRRALPLGHVPVHVAVGIAGLAAVVSLLSSLVAGDGVPATAVLLAGLLSGVVYDLWVSPTPLSPLPFAVAFPLMVVWVGLLAHHGPPAWLCFAAGVPLAIAIHLGDSIPDRSMDAQAGARPLAVILPTRAVRPLAGALLLAGGAVMATTSHRGWLAVVILGLAVAGALSIFRVGAARWSIAAAAFGGVTIWLWKGTP